MDMRELLAIVRNSAVEPVQEAEGERPYICVHAKKGKHECTASSSYNAAKKAAEHWGLKSTAGVDAYLADIKHSTQHVGESESVTEDQDSVDAVAGAITRRIMMQHTDLLSKYGPVKVMAAIDDVADFAGSDGLDEIGSSDVSIWTKQVIQDLESGHYDKVEEADQLDELSPHTLGSYVKKAADSTRINTRWAARTGDRDAENIVDKRRKGINKAVDKLTKEEAEGEDVVDTVTMDVPLLLRMMEYAREDAQEDMDLHDVTERMIAMSKDGPLSMDDYDSIVGSVEALPAPEDHPVEESFYAAGPEAMPGAVGPQDNTNINFSQTKSMGDATVTVSANAKDMAELHKVLKLAGIEVDPGHEDGEAVEVVPVPDSEGEGEPCPQCGSVDCTCPPGECDCGSQEEPEHTNPLNYRYTTDKEALMGMLKDRLAKRLA